MTVGWAPGRSIRSARSPACSVSRPRHCGLGRSATASWSRPAVRVASAIYSRDELEQLRFVVDELEGGATASRRPPAARRTTSRGRQPEPSRSSTASRSSSCSPNAIGMRPSCSSTSCGPRVTTSAWRSTRRSPSSCSPIVGHNCRSSISCSRVAGSSSAAGSPTTAARRCWRCRPLDLAGAALAAGASAFLPKPVVPLQFVSTVRDLLGSSALTRPSPRDRLLMERLSTGNVRLDEVLGGGLVLDAITLVVGAPGTGKTILAEQCLFANATPERPGLYLSTVSEPFDKLLRYGQSLELLRRPPSSADAVFFDDLGVRRPRGRPGRRARTDRPRC